MATFPIFTSYPTFSGITKEGFVPASKNNTDVVAPEVKLYIEGVQVPFQSISVNQTYNSMPTADIQVPPESGLLDITKGYEPKVHIFYRDDNYGGFRLLFWGVIKSNNYSRSRSQSSTYISFHCVHKNFVLDQVKLDFSGWANPNSESLTNSNPNQAAKPNSLNSISMVIEAMSGISGVATTEEAISPANTNIAAVPTDKIDQSLSKFLPRLEGIPGITLNLWNQIKKGAYTNKLDNLALSGMYIPLIEEGIGFFKRMSGHPFLESKLQGSKSSYCTLKNGKEVKILIPPCSRVSISSAVQKDLTIKNISSIVGFSGELTSYLTLITDFINYCKYDISTLSSPAEINADPSVFVDDVNVSGVEKCTIETIIKPQIPFYYSPACNVLLPRMYSSVNVSQEEGSTPTRIAALHDALPPSGGGMNTTFNAPNSVRESIAYNAMLKGVGSVDNLNIGATLGNSFFIPGKYEQGVGMRPSRVTLPWWLALLSADKQSEGRVGQEIMPEKGTAEYNNLVISTAEWRARYATKIDYQGSAITTVYDPTKNNLNPYDPTNTSLQPYHRVMFSTLDYEFSEKVASSRSGFVEGIFNPYIIPGYPMDVVDDSPNHPSFHGYCTSVTHSISSRSISTGISMVAVMTYAELSNFYTMPVAPYLQTALNMVNATIDEDLYSASPAGDTSAFSDTRSTLIQNPEAKAAADSFYRQVLGVGATSPDDLVHFPTGRAYPLLRAGGILVPRVIEGSAPNIKTHAKSAREKDDYYSSVGNLRLVSRPIESMESIATKFNYNFIPLDKNLYNSSRVNYVNPILASSLFLEPGASLFLDYMETSDFINLIKSRLKV